MIHTPVLLNEVLKAFNDIKNGTIIDCTLGYGGHSSAILKQNQSVKLMGFDRDLEAINYSKEYLKKFKDRILIKHSNFSNSLNDIDTSKVRGILADIGVSSLQLDKNNRGFSLNSDSLDMRMNQNDEKDAKFVINSYSANELERIFKDYGELKNAKFIAQKIAKFREKKELTSVKELANLVGLKPVRKGGVLEIILVLQALRIEVNNELFELKNLLKSIENANLKDTVVAIITFHSLEDRIVKNRFKKWEKECICPDFFIKCECGGNHALGKIATKKPITPSKDEILNNSRSKCAKLRIFKIK
ncbi:ribosomal RNA small subunit methyltransferase H [Campylobacter ureolyticus]|uniref:16S rRNA (cytosine(1402)-N(4))-methyltransferase RsmH n=1 Tax=Campylobacter ureolyticus TaxID=827 RepID=UPI00208BACBF|nr:ribosomal RNA small subunit methyltransferase H [Campylobacter ureolyticus]